MSMKRVIKTFIFGLIFLATAVCFFPHDCRSESATVTAPFINIALDKDKDPGNVAVVMQIFLLMTVLTLAPAILIMVTSFTRVAIVLSVLRQAMGTNQMPPTQIILGLALFLTFFIMMPVCRALNYFLSLSIPSRPK